MFPNTGKQHQENCRSIDVLLEKFVDPEASSTSYKSQRRAARLVQVRENSKRTDAVSVGIAWFWMQPASPASRSVRNIPNTLLRHKIDFARMGASCNQNNQPMAAAEKSCRQALSLWPLRFVGQFAHPQGTSQPSTWHPVSSWEPPRISKIFL